MAAARFTGGLSPLSLTLAGADWAWHLAASPERQLALASLAMQLAQEAVHIQTGDSAAPGLVDDDHIVLRYFPF